jgi:hypothetical protein
LTQVQVFDLIDGTVTVLAPPAPGNRNL